jgi:predicted AAA+ superfamily ATPase
LNYESLARELRLSGDTIRNWFQILEDTLLCSLLSPYPFHLTKKETRHSRFYFFDCGVARAAEGLVDFEDAPERRGFYWEGIILNELKAFIETHRKRWKLHYYAAPGLGDVDFVIETKPKSMAKRAQLITLEVKLAKKWKPEFETTTRRVVDGSTGGVQRAMAVYGGDQRLTRGKIEVFPVQNFLDELWQPRTRSLTSASRVAAHEDSASGGYFQAY